MRYLATLCVFGCCALTSGEAPPTTPEQADKAFAPTISSEEMRRAVDKINEYNERQGKQALALSDYLVGAWRFIPEKEITGDRQKAVAAKQANEVLFTYFGMFNAETSVSEHTILDPEGKKTVNLIADRKVNPKKLIDEFKVPYGTRPYKLLDQDEMKESVPMPALLLAKKNLNKDDVLVLRFAHPVRHTWLWVWMAPDKETIELYGVDKLQGRLVKAALLTDKELDRLDELAETVRTRVDEVRKQLKLEAQAATERQRLEDINKRINLRN